jgi:hypothetical protein
VKLLQLVFYPLFLTTTVGLLLAITTMYHLPVTAVWVILAIATGIVCAAATVENTTNQEEDQK